MATRLQMLPPGVHTRAHRHTASTVYLAARGRGRTIVDGTALDWSEHDLFVVPTWAWHQHLNDSAEEAILFSFTDEPPASPGPVSRGGATLVFRRPCTAGVDRSQHQQVPRMIHWSREREQA